MAFATRTWDGWDYVPNAWPVWLTAPDGVLLVASAARPSDGGDALDAEGEALADGQPVAVSRVALLSATEGWVEGIRVDPRVRGLGVATDLQTAELHWLAAHRPSVVRYATGSTNEGSHRLGARHGFELVERFRTWRWRDPMVPEEAGPDRTHGFDREAREDATRRRQALLARLPGAGLTVSSQDAVGWWDRLSGDGTFAAGGRLYELRSWAMQELTQARFTGHVSRTEVLALEDSGGWALAILSGEAMPAEDVSLHLAVLVGDLATALQLATTIRRLADEAIRFRIPVSKPLPPEVEAGFIAAGFETRPFELHILGRSMGDEVPLPQVDPHQLLLVDEPRQVIEPPG